MKRGFPVLTDNHVQQALVEGLLSVGWDVLRAVDVFPERTDDDVLFAHAAREGRVFVTNDEDLLVIGDEWLATGRVFPGLVYWHEEDYAAMTTGDLVRLRGPRCQGEPFLLPDPIHHPARDARPAPRALQEAAAPQALGVCPSISRRAVFGGSKSSLRPSIVDHGAF